MNTQHYLSHVYRGKVAQRYGMETAIDKRPIESAVYLSFSGLDGDQCADKIHHGGLDRALHQYPLEHYQYWKTTYNNQINWQAPGMGENLSSKGMTENNVCVGDRFQWGEAIIEVSQPRSPCFKLNKRWAIDTMSIDMQKNSYCGWLYRVIQPGMVSVQQPLALIVRPTNAMTIRAVCDIFFGEPLCKKGLNQLSQQTTLSDSWMKKIEQRLITNKVENWNLRLFDHI
jgi:MOSC domain-containing protein YiiM